MLQILIFIACIFALIFHNVFDVFIEIESRCFFFILNFREDERTRHNQSLSRNLRFQLIMTEIIAKQSNVVFLSLRVYMRERN